MAKRTLNRKELRADYDAAERRQQDEEERDETEDETAEGEEAATGDEDDAEEKRPKKKPAKAAKPRSRSRAAKVVRMKVVWAVFSNSNQRVATFDYPRRTEAQDLAERLTADKKSTH